MDLAIHFSCVISSIMYEKPVEPSLPESAILKIYIKL